MKGLDTSIIFELVLIGFQVLIWVFLLVLTVFGYNWLDLDDLKEWSAQLSVALVGAAYMFGVIFDKAVSTLPYGWIIGGGALTEMEDLPNPRLMRMEILARNPEVYDILDKRINQHRLVRSTVFNLALISLSGFAFFLAQANFNIRLCIIFVFLSILFLALTLFTGRRSAEQLNLELFHAYRALGGPHDTLQGKGAR
jgi:hypothetical protein